MQNNRALLPPRATQNLYNRGFSFCLPILLKHKTRTNTCIGMFTTEGEQNTPVTPRKGPATDFQQRARARERRWLCSLPRLGHSPPQSLSQSREAQLS